MRRPRRLTQGSRVQKWFCFALFFPTHLNQFRVCDDDSAMIPSPRVCDGDDGDDDADGELRAAWGLEDSGKPERIISA